MSIPATLRVSAVWTGLIAALVALVPPVSASDQPLTVRGGAVVFNRPEFDSVALVEFPFILNRADYAFFRPDSTTGPFYARIFAQVNLFGVDGLAVDSANTYFSAAVSDSAQAMQSDYSLFNSLVLVARPGIYSARLLVIDAVSKNEGELFLDRINVEPPVRDRLALGGKSLAYRIAYVGASPTVGSAVPRSGYEVRCNPTGLYSSQDTIAYIYAELYNLKYDSAYSSDFDVEMTVLNDSGSVYRLIGSRTRPKPGRSAVIVESFDIRGWPPGSYSLQIIATDKVAAQTVAHDLPFAIVAPRLRVPIFSETQEVDAAAGLDLRTQLNLVHFLLTPDERASLERLTENGKRTFVERYWQEKDPDRTTPQLENRLAMYQRYIYANNFYSIAEGQTDGWKTDRGRVLLIYGPADKSERYPHPASGYPYEVWWYYSIKEGKVFVFQDDKGFGDYRLVHSTMEGELFNKRWDTAIRSGGLSID